MRTVVNFFEALIISGAIVYATYGLVHLAVRCVLWMVYSIRRFCDVVRGIQTSPNVRATRADGIAEISHDANSDLGMVAAEMPLPSFLDIAIYVREASEALFTYERHALFALSEMRETAARARETVAQARVLIVEADAIAEGMRFGGRRQVSGTPQPAAAMSRRPTSFGQPD